MNYIDIWKSKLKQKESKWDSQNTDNIEEFQPCSIACHHRKGPVGRLTHVEFETEEIKRADGKIDYKFHEISRTLQNEDGSTEIWFTKSSRDFHRKFEEDTELFWASEHQVSWVTQTIDFVIASFNIYHFFLVFNLIFLGISYFNLITSRHNIVYLLFTFEIIVLIHLLIFSVIGKGIDDGLAPLICICILSLGACEIAIALSLLIRLHKLGTKLSPSKINKLKK